MKNKILFSLILALLLVNSCKKEEISDSISGYVYEEGSGNPIAGVNVFLIAQDYGSWPAAKQMAHTKTDQNGAFTIKNLRHTELPKHYLAASGSDYYELYYSDQTKYQVEETTRQMDLSLIRRANLKVRVINTGDGERVQILSKRQSLDWYRNLIQDTTLDLDTEGFINNTITYFPVTNGIQTRYDTIIYVEPHIQDTLTLYY